jgi:hypothetical protein
MIPSAAEYSLLSHITSHRKTFSTAGKHTVVAAEDRHQETICCVPEPSQWLVYFGSMLGTPYAVMTDDTPGFLAWYDDRRIC